MSRRVSHSFLDPFIGPRLQSLYPRLHVPTGFPPEGIVLIGHALAFAGAVGLALSTTFWWGGLLAAIGIVGNHFADCVDGTHARATGQCRNGGELLDHFTDPISFAYYLVGIGVACGSLELSILLIMLLFAIAVLTNIKAKLIGEFKLERFGPTEFKTLLAIVGIATSIIMLALPHFTTGWFTPAVWMTGVGVGLAAIGLISLPIQLVRSIKEVNQKGDKPDQSEWELAK